MQGLVTASTEIDRQMTFECRLCVARSDGPTHPDSVHEEIVSDARRRDPGSRADVVAGLQFAIVMTEAQGIEGTFPTLAWEG